MKNLIVAMIAITALAASANASYLTNGDFNADAIVVGAQTQVPVNGYKSMGPNDNQITGIPGWEPTLAEGDHGLSRFDDIGGSETEQHAQINNWNRRINQTVSQTVAEGTYDATVDIALRLDNPDQNRGGLFELWAGEPDPANPDVFLPGAILLDSVLAGTAGWGTTPDVVLADRTWTTLSLSYTATAGDPAIGMPLTVSVRTEWGSQGPTYWNNATLTPEPASLLLVGLAGLFLRRR